MKHLIWIAGAAALAAGCTTPAEEPMAGPLEAAATGMPAPAYLASAASSDLFEIESSRLALSRSQNPQVRTFAQMLIDHHTRMSSQLMGTAQSAGLPPPPPQMLPHHMEMLQRLQAAGPGEFDRAYKAEQIMAHEEALNLHRSYAEGGDTPPLRAVAGQAVPLIEQHLAEAQRLPDYTPMPAPDPVSRAGERGR